MGTKGIEAFLNILVATVYLCDVGDAAGAMGTERSNQQGDTRTDVRTRHAAGTQLTPVIMADDHGTVGITEDNLRACR